MGSSCFFGGRVIDEGSTILKRSCSTQQVGAKCFIGLRRVFFLFFFVFFGHSMTSHVVPCLRCFQEVASRAEAAGRGPERPLGSPPARNERSALQPPQGILRSVIRGDIRNCGVSHVGNAGVYTQARVVVRPCVGRCLLVRQTPAKLQLAHNTVACSCNVR